MRPPLFSIGSKKVFAVTWPFHDGDLVSKVHALLIHAGYDVWVQRREESVWELIIGHKDPDVANSDRAAPDSEGTGLQMESKGEST